MAKKVLVKRTWHGDELIARERRANGRALAGMAVGVATEMKKHTHVDKGDLRRSVHAAAVESMGEREVTLSGLPEGAPLAGSSDKEMRTGPAEWKIEVGSWLEYACVENNRGGEHRWADIGWELVQPTFRPRLVRAWREEGL